MQTAVPSESVATATFSVALYVMAVICVPAAMRGCRAGNVMLLGGVEKVLKKKLRGGGRGGGRRRRRGRRRKERKKTRKRRREE